MTDASNRYRSPLETRYASQVMQELWSPINRSRQWRRIWLTLAEEQQKLGIEIPEAALSSMRDNLDNIELEVVAKYEKEFRHDVMAHIHAFGDVAPNARPYLHLGATSAFVTDNADMVLIRQALRVILGRLRKTLRLMRGFALSRRGEPTVAFTHFQPAQLTTVGKRTTLWMQDLALDARTMVRLVGSLPCRGCKGTTGTQASFLELFGGDHEKVRALDNNVATSLGFDETVAVSGQTYTRKFDSMILDSLSGLAQSTGKLANDLRLLQHEGEIMEPFGSSQIGSSAMPYKRNPMRAERISALAHFVIAQQENTAYTMVTQWLERTLDDSANRRLVLPESFLAADAILLLVNSIFEGIEVRSTTIARNVDRVMPFMATERWLMMGVQDGGDRQELHEVIRTHSMEVYEAMETGAANDLVERLASDPAFGALDADRLRSELDPKMYVGRSPEQTEEFIAEEIDPLLETLDRFALNDEETISV